MKVRIAGTVKVLDEESYEYVDNVRTLRRLGGFKCTEEEAADYIGDGAGEETYLAIGLTGGFIKLHFDSEEQLLWVVTEYDSPRELTDDEVQFVVRHTQGQWSDGMGENMEVPFAEKKGLCLELYDPDQVIRVTQT